MIKAHPICKHIAKAPQANASTKALSKSAILPSHTLLNIFVICIFEKFRRLQYMIK